MDSISNPVLILYQRQTFHGNTDKINRWLDTNNRYRYADLLRQLVAYKSLKLFSNFKTRMKSKILKIYIYYIQKFSNTLKLFLHIMKN